MLFGEISQRFFDQNFMKEMWDKYRQENFFVGDLTWEDVNVSVKTLIEKASSLS